MDPRELSLYGGENILMNERHHKKKDWKKIIEYFLLFTLTISIIFIIIQMIQAPAEVANTDHITKTKSGYILMLLQCSLGIVVMKIPSFIEKKKSIKIPDIMEIIYFVFLYCAIYLGEVRDFYYIIPYWDDILHAFSGVMLGALGIILVSFLNDVEHIELELNPFFISFFAFCFALAAGTVWEIYEFTADGLLSLNMQKFALSDGTQLVGRRALSDTMQDLIVDSGSALMISVIGYFNLKKQHKREMKKEHGLTL